MLPQQKSAWFSLAVTAAVCLGFAVVALIVDVRTATACMAILALLALKPRLFGRKTKKGEVLFDERDQFIAKRAALAGFTASYLTFVIACMAIWGVAYLAQGLEEVSVHVLILPVLAGWVVAEAAHAVAVLVLYGREGCDAGE